MESYGSTLKGLGNDEFLRNQEINRKQYEEFNVDIRKIMNASGVYNKREMDWYHKFVRIHGADPFNAMGLTKEYLFFTKPDLHILNTNTGEVADSLASFSFFEDAVQRYRPVCEQLQWSIYSNKSARRQMPFATILSNSVTSNLELPDIESENDQETGANVYGTKITYRGNSYTSDQDCSFSLEFEDTKYLEVYMFFKIYDEYCRLKNMGLIELDWHNNDDLRWINYTYNKILHDQFSIYKIVVGDDGSSIVYWSKYTGVFPTGVPRSAMSEMDNGGGQKLTVNFKAQFVRDMDPVILAEFNRLAGANVDTFKYKKDIPLYDSTNKIINAEWASMPYIYARKDESVASELYNLTKYQLRWKR